MQKKTKSENLGGLTCKGIHYLNNWEEFGQIAGNTQITAGKHVLE
jgi:hypothetical protein